MTTEEMLPTLNMNIYQPAGVTADVSAAALQERDKTQAQLEAEMFANLQKNMDATTARYAQPFTFGQ
jgi:hypothetical protein